MHSAGPTTMLKRQERAGRNPRHSEIHEIERPKSGRRMLDETFPEKDDRRLELLELTLHDLQSPVAILDVSMRLLASDLASASTDVQDTLRDARRATRRIRQYIDHLVVSERLGRGALEL